MENLSEKAPEEDEDSLTEEDTESVSSKLSDFVSFYNFFIHVYFNQIY